MRPPAPARSTTDPLALTPEPVPPSPHLRGEPHMTVMQKKEHNPVGHLSDEDVENLAKELDAIRQRVLEERGEKDAAYIRKVIKTQRGLELGSRAVLLASIFPPAWVVGTVGLSIAKILEN